MYFDPIVVDEIFNDCIFDIDPCNDPISRLIDNFSLGIAFGHSTNLITVKAILGNFDLRFYEDKINLHRNQIIEILNNLPEEFLNGCPIYVSLKDKNQIHWEYQKSAEKLFLLGLAINKVEVAIPYNPLCRDLNNSSAIVKIKQDLDDDERIDLMQIISKSIRSGTYRYYERKVANQMFGYHPDCSYYPSGYYMPAYIKKENLRVLRTIDDPGSERVILYDRIHLSTFNISKEAFLKLILETKYPPIKRYNTINGGFIWKGRK